MIIEPFAVEQWMNEHENSCVHNLAETCVASLTVEELLELTGVGRAGLDELLPLRLTYGDILGSHRLRSAIGALYDQCGVDDVLVTHGAIGANKLVYETVVEPKHRVITFEPTYQQHRSIPASYGADVRVLRLRPENRYLPDLDELRSLVTANTSIISFTNPNNPTGALIGESMLRDIIDIAAGDDAYVLCDEVYRGTDQHGDGTTASIFDLYDRGVAVGSMSKAFSLAGLRLGWIVAPRHLLSAVEVHRDYSTISVGMIDDRLAAFALEHAEQILERSRALTRTNLAILSEWVDDEPRIDWIKPSSGTTALLRYDLELTSREFCLQLLERTGVMLTPGSALAVEGGVRIGYANHTQVLQAGLPLVSEFLAAQ